MQTRAQRAGLARGDAVAIAGMAVFTGACPGLAAFEEALYNDRELFGANSQPEATGKSQAELRLRQAVQSALADAGLEPCGPVGMLVVSEERSLASAPVRRARPLAALSNCSGPVDDFDGSADQALVRAAQLLAGTQAAAVIIGWISHVQQAGAAVVLRSPEDASATGRQPYAVLSFQPPAEVERLGLLTVSGDLSPQRIVELKHLFQVDQPSMSCAISGGIHLALIPALIAASLSLHHRFIPTSPDLPGLSGAAQLEGTRFYRSTGPRAWFQPAHAGPRQAAVCMQERLLLMQEADSTLPRPNQSLPTASMRLFPVAGDSLHEILDGLASIQAALSAGSDPTQLSQQAYEAYLQRPDAAYAAVILGRGAEETLRELEHAAKGIPAAFERGSDWQTPLGSTFSPSPVGPLGSIAFVYPGAFNSYPGMGRDLFRLFPHLHERFGAIASDIGAVLCEELVYPRSQDCLDEAALSAFEARLAQDAIAMLTSGTTLSTLYTMVLRDVFAVEPDAAFGYSLGENSMMFAMGVWTNGDEASRRLSESEVFRTRLSGPQDAVREYWSGAAGAPLWRNFLVMAPPERVLEAMRDEPRVYLTHINTPRQVVIGGDPDACQRVIQLLRSAHLQAPFHHSLHNPAMQSELEGLVALHDSPVVSQPAARLYSASGYRPLRLERHQIARQVGQMLCSSLDFPRLVEQVYADGARIFIELGAGSNCARWVDECLAGRPHVSTGINRRGVDDLTSIARVLAKLVSHRASVDLSPLFGHPPTSNPALGVRMPLSSHYEVQ